MLGNVGLYSYLAASMAFGVLTLLLAISWRGRPFGHILIIASLLTTVWASLIAAGTLMEYPPVQLIQLAELLRNASWIFFLLQLTSLRFDGTNSTLGGRRWSYPFVAIVAAFVALLSATRWTASQLGLRPDLHQDIAFAIWLGMAVLGMLLLEQIYRNASLGERWSIKYLCLGLGALFAYDFFMYAEAMLFRKLSAPLWQARGLVTAFLPPLLAIAIARNSNWRLQVHVSRQVVFHTVTLVGAGLYLVAMATVGYFIKFIGGNWGVVLQIVFLAAAGALLLALLFSGKIRAQTRVFLSKHFYSYRYDYREEWLKFTHALAAIDEDVPTGIIRTMAPLVNSTAGLLWASNSGERYQLLGHWNSPGPDGQVTMEGLSQWMQKSEWIINVDELYSERESYQELTPPDWLAEMPEVWLIIPLLFRSHLQGILVLMHSELKKTLNWEDRDLLKTAGRQAASHLAQYQANQALVEARQFEAFNRLSAYVVHDLKNILAQQTLIVDNAQRHKHNPDFVDDMVATIDNSVDRMNKLMEQMRSGVRGSAATTLNLNSLLTELVAAYAQRQPGTLLNVSAKDVMVYASKDRLYTVFSHLLQNSLEATDSDGKVEIRLNRTGGNAIVEIADTGKGMDANFLKHRLFKPFDSTKGLTGMGIGAFESREFIRNLGGDILVTSTPQRGSLFEVIIPCVSESEQP